MTASAAVSGFGTILNWDTADIAELTSISGPTESMNTIDVTSHDSDDAYAEFVAGYQGRREISI